jgi:hypothetical protein
VPLFLESSSLKKNVWVLDNGIAAWYAWRVSCMVVVCTATVLELLGPEDEGALVFRNVGICISNGTASHPRKL